jgi:hypothetical protein
MVRPYLTVAARAEFTEHGCGGRINRDRVRHDIRRTNAVAGEQRMQPRKRIDVLEALVGPRRRVPLVVAFGIDPY